MDRISAAKRRINMQHIRSKDTLPEIVVRRLLYSMGYRFRLHDDALPGKPDIVLRKHMKLILVNGCFWHMHDCKEFYYPKTNQEFWMAKIQRNVQRDNQVIKELKKLGWDILVVWECETKGKELSRLKGKISDFLNTLNTKSMIE